MGRKVVDSLRWSAEQFRKTFTGICQMPNINRRTLLASFAATALAPTLVPTAAARVALNTAAGAERKPLSTDPSTWTEDEKVWIVARQAGAVNEQKVIWRTRGVIYAFKYPNSPIPLVRFKGCNQQWWRPQEDGSYLRTKAFLTYLTDYETDEMLEQFTNPITGKTVVPSPNSNRLRHGERLSKRGWSHNDIEQAFPDYYQEFSINDIGMSVIGESLSLHSKVHWPEPLVRRPYNQDNTHFARLDDIMDTSIDWVPSHGAGQILMPKMASVGMENPELGQVLWHVEYYKISSYDDLPRDYLERATAEYDRFGVDPVNDTEASKLERRIGRAVSGETGAK
ncbi:MAG: hypothetical protein ACI87W_001452 [Halieaceae bacterium]|jgi:hypothetical protein